MVCSVAIRRFSSAVEQWFCKPKVGGSIPSTGTNTVQPPSMTVRSPAGPTSDTVGRSKTTRAVIWMLGALISFSIIAIAGREASKGADTFQIMFWRSTLGIVVLTVIWFATGGTVRGLKTERLGTHSLRNFIHYFAQYSWLAALPLIPLSQLFAVEFTAPLWVAVLAPLILGEKLTAWRLSAAIIGFAGALIVVRPGAIPLSTGMMFGLLSALGFALGMIMTKRLTATESAFKILFYMQVLQTIIGAVPMASRMAVPEPITAFWIAVVGICGLTAHFCQVRAFMLADAIIVAPLDFLRLPLIAIIAAWLYAEGFDPWVLAGGAVVIAANLINMTGERRRLAGLRVAGVT
jgi:drug/metabolite transporter (DMT)-like permease